MTTTAVGRPSDGGRDSPRLDPERGPVTHPVVAVDVVLLSVHRGSIWVLLTTRTEPPFDGRLAIAGGFLRGSEGLDATARRVLGSKVGLDDVFIEQLYTFGAPRQDPRTRVISVAYYALVDWGTLDTAVQRRPGSGLRLLEVDVPWPDEAGGPVRVLDDDGRHLPLAFDHASILGMTVKRIRGKLGYAPIGFELLPDRFTLRDLRLVHEAILGRPLNKDSFRRRMLERGLVRPTGERLTGVGHRPAELYRFSDRLASGV